MSILDYLLISHSLHPLVLMASTSKYESKHGNMAKYVHEVLFSIEIKAPVLSLPRSFHLCATICMLLILKFFSSYRMKEFYTAHLLTPWINRYAIFYVFDGRYSPGMLISILKSGGAS